jgi:hypothetical protein
MNLDWRRLIAKGGFVNIVHRTITVEMFNRERVMLNVEPTAILWLRRVILYGATGLLPAKFTDAFTPGAICVRQSACFNDSGTCRSELAGDEEADALGG